MLKVAEIATIRTPVRAAARATARVVLAGTSSGRLGKPGTHAQFHCVHVSPWAATASNTSSIEGRAKVFAKMPSSRPESWLKSASYMCGLLDGGGQAEASTDASRLRATGLARSPPTVSMSTHCPWFRALYEPAVRAWMHAMPSSRSALVWGAPVRIDSASASSCRRNV